MLGLGMGDKEEVGSPKESAILLAASFPRDQEHHGCTKRAARRELVCSSSRAEIQSSGRVFPGPECVLHCSSVPYLDESQWKTILKSPLQEQSSGAQVVFLCQPQQNTDREDSSRIHINKYEYFCVVKKGRRGQ